MLAKNFIYLILLFISFSANTQTKIFYDTITVSHSKYSRVSKGTVISFHRLSEKDFEICINDYHPFEPTPKRDSVLEKYHAYKFELMPHHKKRFSELVNPFDLFSISVGVEYKFEFPYIEYEIRKDTLLKHQFRFNEKIDGAHKIFMGADYIEMRFYDFENNLIALKEVPINREIESQLIGLEQLSKCKMIELNYCNPYEDKLSMRFYLK